MSELEARRMCGCIGSFSSGAGRTSIMVYEAGIKEGSWLSLRFISMGGVARVA